MTNDYILSKCSLKTGWKHRRFEKWILCLVEKSWCINKSNRSKPGDQIMPYKMYNKYHISITFPHHFVLLTVILLIHRVALWLNGSKWKNSHQLLLTNQLPGVVYQQWMETCIRSHFLLSIFFSFVEILIKTCATVGWKPGY